MFHVHCQLAPLQVQSCASLKAVLSVGVSYVCMKQAGVEQVLWRRRPELDAAMV